MGARIMTYDDICNLQIRMAAERAFRELCGEDPTDDDLNALEQQSQQALQQQIEDEEHDTGTQ